MSHIFIDFYPSPGYLLKTFVNFILEMQKLYRQLRRQHETPNESMGLLAKLMLEGYLKKGFHIVLVKRFCTAGSKPQN